MVADSLQVLTSCSPSLYLFVPDFLTIQNNNIDSQLPEYSNLPHSIPRIVVIHVEMYNERNPSIKLPILNATSLQIQKHTQYPQNPVLWLPTPTPCST